MAGVALIIASLALLAKALQGIGKLGPTAVAPLIAFASAVSIVAMVLASVGTKLQASTTGIIVFAAAVAAMALAMAPIAQTGLEGAAAMGAFGIVGCRSCGSVRRTGNGFDGGCCWDPGIRGGNRPDRCRNASGNAVCAGINGNDQTTGRYHSPDRSCYRKCGQSDCYCDWWNAV